MLSAPAIWSDHVSVVWCAQQVGLYLLFSSHNDTWDSGGLSVDMCIQWGSTGEGGLHETWWNISSLAVFGSSSHLCVFPVYDSVSFVLLTNICVTILISHRLIFQRCVFFDCMFVMFVCRPAPPPRTSTPDSLTPAQSRDPPYGIYETAHTWMNNYSPTPTPQMPPFPLSCDDHPGNTLILNMSSLSLLSLCRAEVEKGQKDQKDPGELTFSLWFS